MDNKALQATATALADLRLSSELVVEVADASALPAAVATLDHYPLFEVRGERLERLSLPVDLPIWALVSLKVTRPELHRMLGEPHFVETDPLRTCGGEQDAWAYKLPSGQRILVIFDTLSSWAELYGDPPRAEPILQSLAIAPDDERLKHHETFEMK